MKKTKKNLVILCQESQEASAIILSNVSPSVALGEDKCFWKYCKSIVPDWRASATPAYVLCCPESPNKAMAVTLNRQKIINIMYLSECIDVFFRYLSEFTVSVTTGSMSLLDKSHTWRLDAASSMQKTVALVWDHCRETTAAGLCHSATGCSEETAWSLMLPSAHPTWSRRTMWL